MGSMQSTFMSGASPGILLVVALGMSIPNGRRGNIQSRLSPGGCRLGLSQPLSEAACSGHSLALYLILLCTKLLSLVGSGDGRDL